MALQQCYHWTVPTSSTGPTSINGPTSPAGTEPSSKPGLTHKAGSVTTYVRFSGFGEIDLASPKGKKAFTHCTFFISGSIRLARRGPSLLRHAMFPLYALE